MNRRVKIAMCIFIPQIIIVIGIALGTWLLWIDHREYFIFDRGVFVMYVSLLLVLFLNCNVALIMMCALFDLKRLKRMNVQMEKDLLMFSDIVEKCTKTQIRKIDELSRIMEQHL
jgi:hypothetical protein